MSLDKTRLPFKLWTESLSSSFGALSTLWWRFGVVTISYLLTLIVATATIAAGLFYITGGSFDKIESLIVNLANNGNVDPFLLSTLGIGALLFLLVAIVLGINAQIANLILVKEVKNGNTPNPFKVFFKDAWHYFWRYNYVMFMIFWKIIWRVVLIGAVILILIAASVQIPALDLLTLSLSLAGAFILIGLVVWMTVKYLFSYSYLIKSDLTGKESLEKSEELIEGSWWSAFTFLAVLVVAIILISLLIEAPILMSDLGLMTFPKIITNISEIVSALVSIFLIAPIATYFMYELMYKVAEEKKLKL